MKSYKSEDCLYLKDRNETVFAYALREYPESPVTGEDVEIDGVVHRVKMFTKQQSLITPITGRPPTIGCIHVEGDARK